MNPCIDPISSAVSSTQIPRFVQATPAVSTDSYEDKKKRLAYLTSTKYKLGDMVFAMCSNAIIQGVVISCRYKNLNYDENSLQHGEIEYVVHDTNTKSNYASCILSSSLEEMLDILYLNHYFNYTPEP